MIELATVIPTIDPIPAIRNQQEGHGEGCKHDHEHFFCPTGQRFRKDRPFVVSWEGNFMGRVHGDREWLILAWNGTDYSVLERIHSNDSRGIREVKADYKGLTNEQAIQKTFDRLNRFQAENDARPKCRDCGRGIIRLAETQPKDQCFMCFEKGKKVQAT